jgi:hypothetical protein
VGDGFCMLEHAPQLVYRMRFVLIGTVVLLSFLLMSLFLSAVKPAGPYVGSVDYEYVQPEGTNVVSNGMDEFIHELSGAGESVKEVSVAALIGVTEVAETGRQAMKNSVGFMFEVTGSVIKGVVRTTGTVIGSVANWSVSGLVYLLEIPGNIVGFIGNTAVMGTVIRPADHAQVPLIDPDSPALFEARTALATPVTGQAQPAEVPMWPIRGEVTTRFGVKHWPYQATHTGIDISDGKRAGITPIYPFKSGTVVFAGRANNGLGNHVILDHGNGVTSVYAHLSVINVVVGQVVNQSIVLGTEGSTGVSTGTHLHFEIRVNGMAADPNQFIPGRPN